jgi:surface antigen
LALVVALLGAAAPSAAIAGHHHRHHHKRHHRPHRQAVAGPLRNAHVKIVRAPSVHGKGGGVDPGDDYPSRWKAPAQDSVVDQWGMYNRECTSFVAWALHSRNGFEVPFHQNANRWGPLAAKRGFVVNANPSIGAVAWSNAGVFGHVAYVVAVNGGNVTVEEYNYLEKGGYDKRVVSASAFTGFIHFKDLPSESVTVPPSTSPPVTPPAPTPPPSTYAETTGGVTHTWTNYTNAGGTQGPSIPSNATVQIACALTGFKVADGNTWWYRIASSPWSNVYYASADAFYNNGKTSGSLVGTPFVDPAVPGC